MPEILLHVSRGVRWDSDHVVVLSNELEAIAQVAGVMMLRQAENFGKLAYFMSAESVRWRKPVRPGDTLVISVELIKSRGKIGKAKGVCSVNGDTVSEAEVTFILFDRQ